MKRLVYAYSIGLATCFISVSIANYRPSGRVSILPGVLLGISSRVVNATGRRTPAYMALAAALVSSLFVLADALRSRDSWLRWLGYGLWGLIAFASIIWITPPNI
jgi:hypothetical protein